MEWPGQNVLWISPGSGGSSTYSIISQQHFCCVVPFDVSVMRRDETDERMIYASDEEEFDVS